MTHPYTLQAIRDARESNNTSLHLMGFLDNSRTELPSELLELTQLTILRLTHYRLNDLPDWLDGLQMLEELDLSNNELQEIPVVVSRLPNLRRLKLNSNNMRNLPLWLNDLPNLVHLELVGNDIEFSSDMATIAHRLQGFGADFDLFRTMQDVLQPLNIKFLSLNFPAPSSDAPILDAYRNLNRLRMTGQLKKSFDLAHNGQLTSLILHLETAALPGGIDQLSQLRSLNIAGNQLTALPENLGQLNQLQSLNVADNQIAVLPESIVQLDQLQSLEASRNQLTFLPKHLGKLSRLQSLAVADNQLTALPESLGQLGQLRALDIGGNQLTTLPESLGQLSQFQSIDVSRNQLTTLPESLCQLSQLQSLSIWSNQLATLPESLGQLSQLQALDIGANQLTTLPESICKLSQLQSLSAWANQLISLPESLGQLSRLQMLDIGGNQLSALPESLGQLSQLRSLSAWDNQITTFPESLCQLSHLLYLRISRNRIKALPEGLYELTQLQSLDIGHNQLITLPEQLCQLSQLESIDVSHNQLLALPEQFGQLNQLKILDVAHNQLHDLPKGLRKLPLRELWLQDNPGLGIPDAVLGRYLTQFERHSRRRFKNPAAILEAFFSARELDGQALDEIKLVLVGRGAAGKTSVAHRLIHNRFKRSTHETQGVDISHWPPTCGERKIDVNVWDFAGQVVTHSTHSFFMSDSSVYLLVLTGREDTQKSDADYWLRLIRAYATDTKDVTSPVIVLLNKYGEHPFKVDRNALREKYPFIAGFIETDCKNGLGFDALRHLLVKTIEVMPITQQRFKLAWWRIKEKLERAQRRKNHFAYTEFQSICNKDGETDPELQRFLASVLHALGVALNYGDDERLRNATVLNPRWVTESIYTLLRTAVADDGSAELTADRVAAVLPGEEPLMRNYLVELMRRFDLAFPLDEHGGRWLVPQRLPAEQPDLGDEWLNGDDATRLRFSYPVIPEGLLPRFISRTYPLSETEDGTPLPRWANGVVLQDRGARALIRVDNELKQINIVCKGPKSERLFLLGVIQDDFRELHEQIPGLEQKEELEVEGRRNVFMPVSTLRADEAKGQTSHANTPDGSVPLNATSELDRLSEPAARRNEWRAKVFISYSSTDARLKDELMIRLKPMREAQGLILTWDDRCITPGEDWDKVIRTELEEADVILLLVSPRFLASDYIRDIEIAAAVRRANAGEAKLVQLILDNCGYAHESFGKFNALPIKGKPVRDHRPQRHAWYQIEEELRKLFLRLRDNHISRATSSRKPNQPPDREYLV